MSEEISLDGIRMRTVTTDPGGVVSSDTIVEFSQSDNLISARYRGGSIREGFLIGFLDGTHVKFRYVQAAVNGDLDSGISNGTLSRLANGKLQLVENFQWVSRTGSGSNIFQEL